MGRIGLHSRIAGPALLLCVCIACSGGGAAPAYGTASSTAAFWTADFSSEAPTLYKVNASLVGKGAHCYLYLEKGRKVERETIDEIVNEFDNIIYPSATAAFGSEPNPGADKDPRIYILLLDIMDGYNQTGQFSYIAGYFDAGNEYDTEPYSNGKEIVYMDIYPAVPGSSRFLNTLAHEFQHMIHWEQKEHKRDTSDDAWLNEGMSEIAPAYCGYGPSYSRVLTFEKTPSDSLTSWNSSLSDYAVVYMWAQYFKDRFESSDPDIFRRMLQNDQTGIDSVNEALKQIDASLTFTSTFNDWTIANYSGSVTQWPGHPEWSYRTIHTQAGMYGGVILPGLFPEAKQNPPSPLQSLRMWSVDYYSYTPASLPEGTLTWTSANSSDRAILIDPGAPVQTELVSKVSYSISSRSFLIVSNPAESDAEGVTVIRTTAEAGFTKSQEPIGAYTQAVKSPKALLEEASLDVEVRERAERSGELEALCVHGYFSHKEKTRRAKGARPHF